MYVEDDYYVPCPECGAEMTNWNDATGSGFFCGEHDCQSTFVDGYDEIPAPVLREDA